MHELGVLTGWHPSFRSSSARRMALCLGLVPGLVSASFASEQRIKDLVEAHSSAIALVRQLDAEMEFTSQMLAGTLAGREPIPTVRWRWSFDSTRQRFRSRILTEQPRADGAVSGVADIFNDGQDTFQINGWDGDAKKQPNLLDQGTVRATVREGVTEAPLQHLQTVMLHRFSPHFKSALPLKELLDGIRPQDIEYIAATTDPDVEGIRIKYPAEPQKYSKMQVDVFLSAKVNFFATKLIERKEGVMLANDKTGVVEPHVMEVSIKVKEFRDCGGGVWIPVKTEGETRKSGYDGPIMKVVGKVTQLTVNQPLPADALNFHFPENVFVTRFGTDGKVRHTELWKDGKVEREVKSTEELNTLFTAEAARTGKPQPGWRFGYLTIWGGLIGLLICLAGYRVWRKRA